MPEYYEVRDENGRVLSVKYDGGYTFKIEVNGVSIEIEVSRSAALDLHTFLDETL